MTTYAECGACHARIAWATDEHRRRVPLDYAPDPGGIIAGMQDEHGGWHARSAAPGAAVIAPWKRMTSHLATCTDPGWWNSREPARQQEAAQGVRDELAELRARQGQQRQAWGKAAARHAAAGRNKRGRRGR